MTEKNERKALTIDAGDVLSCFDIGGKSVLLTGAGRGIGRGIARVFAAVGARVAINALSDTAAGPLVESIRSGGGKAYLAVGDVTTASGAQRVMDTALDRLGSIDVLVNGLGDSIGGRIVAESDDPGKTEAMWHRVIDINLTHVFLIGSLIGRHMLDRGRGKVINVSSFGAVRGGVGRSAYAAAKAGLNALTRTMALEWAPHIQVNGIAPGSFPDDEVLNDEELKAADGHALKDVPLGRVGRPREVGYLALYLASSASDYMTGQTIYLDGGRTSS